MKLNRLLIVATRKGKGVSHASLAEAVGVTSSTISQIETGEIENPRLELLNKIADVLEVPTAFFFDNISVYPSEYNKVILYAIQNNVSADELMAILEEKTCVR